MSAPVAVPLTPQVLITLFHALNVAMKAVMIESMQHRYEISERSMELMATVNAQHDAMVALAPYIPQELLTEEMRIILTRVQILQDKFEAASHVATTIQ